MYIQNANHFAKVWTKPYNTIRTFFSIDFVSALALTWYAIYQFLETGLEIILLIPFIVSIARLRKKAISKSFLYSLALISLCIAPTFITGGYLFGLKILFYTIVANFVSRSHLFRPRMFFAAIIIHAIIYFLFFAEKYNKFDNLPFFVFAPNYFVFLVVFPLLAIKISPLLVSVLSLISLSRWNFFSVISSYSRILALLLLVGAFINLVMGSVDTTFGLKEASDGDRLNLLQFQINTLGEYIIGKPVEMIRIDILDRVGVTTDTFEGLLFDAYSLFGMFGLAIVIYHIRIIKNINRNEYGAASIYLFMYSFFNPVIYSFAYYLFAEYCLRKIQHNNLILNEYKTTRV